MTKSVVLSLVSWFHAIRCFRRHGRPMPTPPAASTKEEAKPRRPSCRRTFLTIRNTTTPEIECMPASRSGGAAAAAPEGHGGLRVREHGPTTSAHSTRPASRRATCRRWRTLRSSPSATRRPNARRQHVGTFFRRDVLRSRRRGRLHGHVVGVRRAFPR